MLSLFSCLPPSSNRHLRDINTLLGPQEPERVIPDTALDARKLREELEGTRTSGLAVADGDLLEFPRGVLVRDGADGGDGLQVGESVSEGCRGEGRRTVTHSSGTASERLGENAVDDVGEGDGAKLDVPTEGLGDGDETLGGDRLEDRLRLRADEGRGLVGSGRFLDR
jgi:hypothetical protein